MKKRFIGCAMCIILMMFFVSSTKATQTVIIYTEDKNADYLVEQTVKGKRTAEDLIEKLVEYHMLSEQTSVLSYRSQKIKGNVIGYLDLSKEYLEVIEYAGTAGEIIYVYCVVNTFIKNLSLDEVKLTVEGSEIQSGHISYEESLSFYDHIIPMN